VPHPLARDLAGCLEADARVLLLGVGSGRNVPPLLAAGARVDVVEEDPERARAAVDRFAGDGRVRVVRARYAGPIPFAGGFAAALTTHALQHGSLGGVTGAVAAVRSRLAPGAPFFLTLGSKRDPRFASGRRIAPNVAAPLDGSEAGVAHVYLDEPEVRAVLAGFEIESANEASAAETAGRWAHPGAEADGLVHWFVRARRI
jgi:hypothetical protein